MPLSQGRSKQAFSKNVSTEMRLGKSQPQSLAIAYSLQRRAKGNKKLAMGGSCYADGGAVEKEHAPSNLLESTMLVDEANQGHGAKVTNRSSNDVEMTDDKGRVSHADPKMVDSDVLAQVPNAAGPSEYAKGGKVSSQPSDMMKSTTRNEDAANASMRTEADTLRDDPKRRQDLQEVHTLNVLNKDMLEHGSMDSAVDNEETAPMKRGYASGGFVDDSPLETEASTVPEERRQDLTQRNRRLPSDPRPQMPEDADMLPNERSDTPMTLEDQIVASRKMLKYADGGLVKLDGGNSMGRSQDDVVDAIMAQRKGVQPPAAENEELDPDFVNDMEPVQDLSQYHHVDDDEHDDIPAEEEDEIVGQILRSRRDARRGM